MFHIKHNLRTARTSISKRMPMLTFQFYLLVDISPAPPLFSSLNLQVLPGWKASSQNMLVISMPLLLFTTPPPLPRRGQSQVLYTSLQSPWLSARAGVIWLSIFHRFWALWGRVTVFILVFCSLNWFPVAAVWNHHKLGGLEQHRFILSLF